MKKRLLFIIWSFSYGGGAEKQLATLVNGLDSNKYDIDIIEFYHSNIDYEKINSNVHILKPINDAVNESKIKRKIINILAYIAPSIVRKMYIKNKYDYEISFNYLIPTFLLSNNKNCKRICVFHGPIWNLKAKKNIVLKFIQKKHLMRVDRIVAISKETYNSILSIFPTHSSKTTIINNGYDFKAMDEKSNLYEPIIKGNCINLLFCNRLDINKNPFFLIEVAKKLHDENLKFHLNILGSGELKNDLIDCINKYDLNSQVSLIGYVSNPYPYIKKCDIICLTSKSEGFSTFLIEGLHFKKPFISTQTSVPLELKNCKCGYITDDVEEYANYIKKLIDDRKQYVYMSEKCYSESKKYTIENQIANYEKLLEEVFNDKS